MMQAATAGFPIPASLQDLEREPYNLLPYPDAFDDSDEAARADSFEALVLQLEQSNRTLAVSASSISLFEDNGNDDDNDDKDCSETWNNEERTQALYTLVRKSISLAPATRQRLVAAICQALQSLSRLLHSTAAQQEKEGVTTVVPQAFRDAFSCHLYMLYSILFFLESEAKGNSSGTAESADVLETRKLSADTMLAAAVAMADHRAVFWQRGVPDESVVVLPCRIAYQMLERSTGVLARKAACADQALRMIAVTVDSADCLLNTVTAALMDLLHSYEHMAVLVAELVAMENQSDRLAVELIREIGRLEGGGEAKVSGIKNVAPFVSELAAVRPRLVLANLSYILPHLDSEPYNMRSSIVTALSHILQHLGRLQQQQQQETESPVQTDNQDRHTPVDVSKSQAALLDLLMDRVYDVSSFTRSAVLKAWIRLTESGSLPKERVLAVTAMAIDRLQDKTVAVRKQSMHLLTTLLENNPFMGSLDPTPYRQKLAELYHFVKNNMPISIEEAHQAALKQADDAGEEEAMQELEQAALSAAIAEAGIMVSDDSGELTQDQQEYCRKVQALKFTQSALDFIDIFEDANIALEGMLLSANTSDVTEALHFFVQARHFKLPCAVTGMKRALALMWSTEQSIRDEVLKAFVDVFIAEPGSEGGKLLPENQIAKNLLVLVGQASVSEIASIEEAIVRLVKDERIPADVFLILWSIASKGSADARAAALQLLSMGAGADRTIIDSKSRLKLLLDAGLGDYTQERKDWRLAGAAACALQRIERAKVDPSDAKYLVLERIMEELAVVVRGDWCDDNKTSDTLQWFSAAEQSVKALFVICPEPEVDCTNIIVGMYSAAMGDDIESCHSLRLARLFHVLGQVALNLLVYTEVLTGSLRRANAKQSLKKQETADKANASKKASAEYDSSDDDAIEVELGIAAQAEAETERNLSDISENEILGRGLISAFGPLLVCVVANEGDRFNSEILMQAAVLALCRFMCVSSTFCEKHLPVLFTALANAPPEDTTMRANTVVALGDLAFRFPNEVEPYTPRLYACLRDSSTKVRRHTLMVLTHLILNDMVKVKGQVCEIALCLRDDDQRIRDMSRLLFHELSKRSNNPVYNLLPDIISQLSQLSMRHDDFRSIMSFLLGYIKKEKQNEMLTEKLCQRFPKCTSISQKADLAYCIAQLKLNERAIKCLSDNFKLYKDALFDEDIMKSFASVVTKAKKFMKPEMREFLEEWEAKLNELAELGAENEAAGEKAARAKVRASKRAARKKKQVKVLDAVLEDEEEEADELEFEGEVDSVNKENTPVSTKKSRSSARGQRGTIST